MAGARSAGRGERAIRLRVLAASLEADPTSKASPGLAGYGGAYSSRC